jgi:hypothetical protein
LSVVWLSENDNLSTDPQAVRLRVQFQIQCDASKGEICELAEIARNIQLVDTAGILYDPVFDQEVEKPLEGETLSGAEKAGWLLYQVPRGVKISAAVAHYSPDQSVFFGLPGGE